MTLDLKPIREALEYIAYNACSPTAVGLKAEEALQHLATLEAQAEQQAGREERRDVNHYDMDLAGDFDDGTSLYVVDNEAGGRTYYSDEIGCGVLVWDTALVSRRTIEAALSYDATYEGRTTPPAPEVSEDELVTLFTGFFLVHGLEDREAMAASGRLITALRERYDLVPRRRG